MIAYLPPVSSFRRHWDGDTRPVVDTAVLVSGLVQAI